MERLRLCWLRQHRSCSRAASLARAAAVVALRQPTLPSNPLIKALFSFQVWVSNTKITKCAEMLAGKAHIPLLTMIPTASRLSTYSMAIMDGKRTRITKEDLCDHDWEFRFTIAAPEYWRNLDPSWKHTGPPMRRYFHPDGYHSADPHDAVWGGHECTYTIITSFAGDGQIRDHYVRINRWPPMKVSRKEDWSWELSNHLYRYNSVPDGNKGCTGPLFPVW
ncbi:uncharacterized protein LOC102712936 isoform X2 [Oryza brachyantha]|uniref:uncharacterized protein LOC102712936 isoform X2 n=1 Tax=Oryza brachyantha TaxID=4533 RepID=UPI0007769E2F|nr:uncharacterized protein LOC102712936 isoform X2 [Oryza brachyantha]